MSAADKAKSVCAIVVLTLAFWTPGLMMLSSAIHSYMWDAWFFCYPTGTFVMPDSMSVLWFLMGVAYTLMTAYIATTQTADFLQEH